MIECKGRFTVYMTQKQNNGGALWIFIRISPFYVVGMFSFVVNHEILSSCLMWVIMQFHCQVCLNSPPPTPPPPSHHHHSRNNKQTNKPMIVWSWCGGMLATTKAFVVFGSTLSMNLIPTVDITKYKRCGCVALSGWRAVSPSLPLQFRVSLILNSLTKLPTTSAELTSHVEPQMIGIKTALLSLANTDKNKAGARSQKGWATQILHSCPWPCLTP